MNDMAALDAAHAAMMADEHDDDARLAYFGCLADTTLMLLLAREPEGDDVEPELVETSGGTYVLAFDSEERLADFAAGEAAYAELSGRGLAELLAGQGMGIGVNLSVAPSEFLIPADAVDWLAGTLAKPPTQGMARPASVAAPGPVPPALMAGLARKLDGLADLAEAAFLVDAGYTDGIRNRLLVIVGAEEQAAPAIAVAISEAVAFSGLEQGALDVTFAEAGSRIADQAAAVGQALALTSRAAVMGGPSAPGMNPDKPPRLH